MATSHDVRTLRSHGSRWSQADGSCRPWAAPRGLDHVALAERLGPWTLSLALCAVSLVGCERSDGDEQAKQDTSAQADSSESQGGSQASKPEPSAQDPSDVYLQWRDRFEKDPQLARKDEFERMRDDLREMTNSSSVPAPLRANAALLLGAAHESRKEVKPAIGLYRHASKLMPDDAGPHMALAVALAGDEQFADAAKVQARATELDPDNLENWLALAELRLKSGDEKGAKTAYVDYERRRKGLIDGLTLQRDGQYIISATERAGCAQALSASVDQGTANALIYALKTEPEADVRAAVAEVMGVQRLSGYRPALEAALKSDKAPQVREAIAWALGEISRDPVELEAEKPPQGSGDDGDEAPPKP